MKVLSLYSGDGGIDLGLEWAGMEIMAFCEANKKCQLVLKKRWPNALIYDDARTLTYEQLKADGIKTIDLICGGFPCQPFSSSGLKKGQDDDRYLWPEMFRLIKEIKPPWILVENVVGIIKLALDQVLSDLESEGYTTQPFVIPACAVNAPHRRDRVWIVANSTSLMWREDHKPTKKIINLEDSTRTWTTEKSNILLQTIQHERWRDS